MKGIQKSEKETASSSKKCTVDNRKQKKRQASQKNEDPFVSHKRPKQAAARSRRDRDVVDEDQAVCLTASVKEDGRLCRRLTNFTLYNSNWVPRPFEMLEVEDIFISGLILPLEEGADKEKGEKCDGFGRIEDWSMSGFEDGSPVIWISTKIADYECIKPSKSYKKIYDHFYTKARACVETYMILSSLSGNYLSLDELVAGITRAMSGMKCFSDDFSVRDFVVSQGDFIYKQLIGLDGQPFRNLPILASLGDRRRKFVDLAQAQSGSMSGNFGDENETSSSTHCQTEEDDDSKMTRLLQEQKQWQSMKQKKTRDSTSSSKYNLKIDEATTTRLVKRVWGRHFHEARTPELAPRQPNLTSSSKEAEWVGDSVGKLSTNEALYTRAIVHGIEVAVKGGVILQDDGRQEHPEIYLIEYMFESVDGTKMFHGRRMQRGCQTVLGNTANEREVFLKNECVTLKLETIKESVGVDIRSTPWGHQHRKETAKAEERKQQGLPTEFYCRSLYLPERGAFVVLPYTSMGLGSGSCQVCKLKEAKNCKDEFDPSSFEYKGNKYSIGEYLYVSPYFSSGETKTPGVFKCGRNVGLKAYIICQLLEILKQPKNSDVSTVKFKVRRFYRPEDVSPEKAYSSDIREVYYSKQEEDVPVNMIKGKCKIKRKNDLVPQDAPLIFDHVFFCEHQYDPSSGSVKKLPPRIKLNGEAKKSRKKRGKAKEGKTYSESEEGNRLHTLDIFAGCGGLSEGLEKSGVSCTKWAIECDKAAGEAFRLNHPRSLVFLNDCNVLLRAIMQKCGDVDDCVSTPKAAKLASSLKQEELNNLPLPGQVDFISGGPPCQGFSGMNRYNQSTWSKAQCQMILAFLSFADYYRPKYFLLENVRNFVSFDKGQAFRLTLASLLEMGYQVRFGILEAGAYGVPQSRKRAFIWAASPEEVLPEWPEPMHVFATPELKISLGKNLHYSAVRSTSQGAPFRSLTVRDAIGDLPPVANGASDTSLEYQSEPISWFQKVHRAGSMDKLTDHISKEMNEINLIRCQRIPKRPGADWRDLPNEKVKLSNGDMDVLIPKCLSNAAKKHKQSKGQLGRLDWEGNFPTSITDPRPMGTVGMCFHPEQDRIVTVREYARSQGFTDSYKFRGTVLNQHRQIGNAVPPPLAYALGTKLKEAVQNRA